MSESDDIQQLIRLKRHEQPHSEFVEEFVRNFQDRQRSELLRQSARSLLWERITAYFEDMTAPQWGLAAAGMVALASAAYLLRPVHLATSLQAADPAPQTETYIVRAINAVNSSQPPPQIDERNLIARHYDSGFTDWVEVTPNRPYNSALLQTGLALGEEARLYPR